MLSRTRKVIEFLEQTVPTTEDELVLTTKICEDIKALRLFLREIKLKEDQSNLRGIITSSVEEIEMNEEREEEERERQNKEKKEIADYQNSSHL